VRALAGMQGPGAGRRGLHHSSGRLHPLSPVHISTNFLAHIARSSEAGKDTVGETLTGACQLALPDLNPMVSVRALQGELRGSSSTAGSVECRAAMMGSFERADHVAFFAAQDAPVHVSRRCGEAPWRSQALEHWLVWSSLALVGNMENAKFVAEGTRGT